MEILIDVGPITNKYGIVQQNILCVMLQFFSWILHLLFNFSKIYLAQYVDQSTIFTQYMIFRTVVFQQSN